MGAVTPLAYAVKFAPIVAGVASTAISKSNSDATNSAANQRYQNNMATINVKQVADERARAEVLKRQKSSQLAKFGAMGISSGDGSSAAILKGMQSKSDAQLADQSQLVDLSRDGLSIGIGTNLLSKNSTAVQNNLDKLLSSD